MIIFRNMVGRTSLFLVLGSLILCLCLVGCKNPFRTRESAEPINREGTGTVRFQVTSDDNFKRRFGLAADMRVGASR